MDRQSQIPTKRSTTILRIVWTVSGIFWTLYAMEPVHRKRSSLVFIRTFRRKRTRWRNVRCWLTWRSWKQMDWLLATHSENIAVSEPRAVATGSNIQAKKQKPPEAQLSA